MTDDSGNRNARSKQPASPTPGDDPPSQRPRRRVGDRVVEQHREGGEADRAAHVDDRAPATATTTPTASSARCGLPNRGCTAASACGRWRSRAIASVVRETPSSSASSEPSAATAAPTPDHGTERRPPAARTASASGAVERSQPGRPEFRQHGDRDHGVDDQRDAQRERNGARNGAGGIAHLLAEGGDAGIPGEREEQQARRLKHAAERRRRHRRPSRAASTSPKPRIDDHHGGEDGQHHRDDDPREPARTSGCLRSSPPSARPPRRPRPRGPAPATT